MALVIARPGRVLAAISVAFFTVRAYATDRIGFGDSEALYATYAMHPQPAYLDHPGLVGIVARAIGHGAAPSPSEAHFVTSIAATLVPVLGALAARAAGATWRRALLAAIAIACAPEIAVGLFALTPDLLLAIGWLGALALAAHGLSSTPGSARAGMSLLGAGLLAGVAATAKVTAIPLMLALAFAYAGRAARPHARTVWPWAGLAVGAAVFAPVVLFEASTGWPMLRHRLVETQAGAGVSLRNFGALTLGQLAYVSPLLALLGIGVARSVVRARDEGAVERLLFGALVVPLAVLVPLALWSRVAEPHWLAPPLLALPIAWAQMPKAPPIAPRLGLAACLTGLAMSAAAHAWVLVPSLARLMPSSFDPRLDIASELYGWPEVARAVKEVPLPSGAADSVVVGPHWVVCAQLAAALGPRVRVGCATPIRDDFDDWLPRDEWRRAGSIVWVTDNRFDVDFARVFPDRSPIATRRVTIMRGGRPARTFSIAVLERSAIGLSRQRP